MNIIILGPQGSGKGTQAQLLADKFGFNYFEAGKTLREMAVSDRKVKAAIDNGLLVPDELVKRVVTNFIANSDQSKGFLFDGYPRTVSQYNQLKNILARAGQKIDRVINLEISEDESIRRLSARCTDPQTGEIYNLLTNPPLATVGKGSLVQREDDYPGAIKRRLSIYRSQTHPVFERARAEGIGVEIDGERPIDIIHQDVLAQINDQTHP